MNMKILYALAIGYGLYFLSRRRPLMNSQAQARPVPRRGELVTAGPGAGTYNVQADVINEKYDPINLTLERARTWSKTALIEAGLYDPLTNRPTAAFYALPRRG